MKNKQPDLNLLLEEYTSRLEQKVAYESQYFRLMADAMPQIVWTATPEGQADYFNQKWYEYTGQEPGQAAVGGFMHPDDLKLAEVRWEEAMESGDLFEMEYRLREGKTGEYKWFLARALPGIGSNQEIFKWFGTCTDIDDHKRSQAKKDEFIAVASHELKTPVTSIKAFAQLLARRMKHSGDEKSYAYVSKMDSQLDKLTSLIKELLDVSKIDSGQLAMRLEEFDFDSFVQETIENLRLISGRHAIELEGSTKKKVVADKNRLEQVLSNFVTNAIKYSPRRDRILLRLGGDESHVKLEVQDFGVGIPSAEQTKVFDRFYRVGGSKRETFAGLGLGLFISSDLIRRQGGKIGLDSQEGKGSTFYFTLPATGGVSG